jgi:mannosylglycerate hydrolase MGH1-like protein
MDRRTFLAAGAASAAAALLPKNFAALADELKSSATQEFTTDNLDLQNAYNAALQCLRENSVRVFRFPNPVLIEGSVYRGVWLECAPLEGLVYSLFDRAAGIANHKIFFDLQREDGYLPCNVKADSIGTGQIQMVVPIAATALEIFERFGDSQFLETAYRACASWDAWLMRYRNTRGTGLCEGFCEYDTGHDNSPRWTGVPKQCPDHDARIMPSAAGLPRLCPDLSSTVYGGRVALAKMAKILGRTGDADRWETSAHTIQKLILQKLYDSDDACFYDLDANDKFVRIRGDLLTRVLGEHVVDQRMFERIYEKQIHNPKAFWAAYPLPSIAMDDPTFVRPIPRNSWGGASQALTALRAPRWMEFYGKPADMAHMMRQWAKAILTAGGGLRQQMDPLTGEFSTADPSGYSPAALVLLDYTWRLHGVRQVGNIIEWNCRAPEKSTRTEASIQTKRGAAMLTHTTKESVMEIAGKTILRVSGTVRLLTDDEGHVIQLVGISEETAQVEASGPNEKKMKFTIAPNAIVQVN